MASASGVLAAVKLCCSLIAVAVLSGYAVNSILSMLFEFTIFCLWTFGWRRALSTHGTWGGCKAEAYTYTNGLEYIRFALPMVLMSTYNSGADAVVVLASAKLGTQAVSTIAILSSLKGLIKSAFVGAAVQVRIASLMVTQPQRARRLFWAVYFVFVLLSSLVACVLYLVRYQIAATFSSDAALQELVLFYFPFMLLEYVLGVGKGCLHNGLVAISCNSQLSNIELISSWFVQVPVSIYLMLWSDWTHGITGYYCGAICGEVVRISVSVCLMLQSDWNFQAKLARQRSSSSSSSS